jgi:fluoride exporter
VLRRQPVTPAHPFRARGDRFRGDRARGDRFRGDRFPIDPDIDPADPSAPAPGHRRSPVPVHRSHPGVLLAIAAGGFVGALGRYELELAWPVLPGHFPSSTFVINTSGAFLLGLLLTITIERDRARTRRWRTLRLVACVGVLGAWTTMSTVAVEADSLVRSGDAVTAVAYLAATMAAGLAAAAVGTATGRLHRRVGPGAVPGDGGDR